MHRQTNVKCNNNNIQANHIPYTNFISYPRGSGPRQCFDGPPAEASGRRIAGLDLATIRHYRGFTVVRVVDDRGGSPFALSARRRRDVRAGGADRAPGDEDAALVGAACPKG